MRTNFCGELNKSHVTHSAGNAARAIHEHVMCNYQNINEFEPERL